MIVHTITALLVLVSQYVFISYSNRTITKLVSASLLIFSVVLIVLYNLWPLSIGVVPAALNARRAFKANNDASDTLVSSAKSICVLTLLIAGAAFLVDFVESTNIDIVLSLAAALFSIFSASVVLIKIRSRLVRENYVESDHPETISLLLPARNEDHALNESLKNALRIDYERMEIIALNDASQDNTSDIIRQFAHDGVRFIENGELPDGWIGKNYALNRLAQESSGDFLIFCDVDITLAPQALSKIVSYMNQKELDMLSIVPKRIGGLVTNIFQPLTPLWQFMLPNFLRNDHKSTSQNCWVLRRECFLEKNFFDVYKSAIQPQRYFAQYALERKGYKLLLANDVVDVSVRKRFNSTVESRIRGYFPLLNGDLGISTFLLIVSIPLLLVPYVGVFVFSDVARILSVISVCSVLIAHLALTYFQSPKSLLLALINFPISYLFEFGILLASIYQYEFSPPEWKNRQLPARAILQDS